MPQDRNIPPSAEEMDKTFARNAASDDFGLDDGLDPLDDFDLDGNPLDADFDGLDETDSDDESGDGDAPGRGGATGKAGASSSLPKWAEVWQIPTFILSLALLLAGSVLLMTTRPVPDYDALLDAVEVSIEGRDWTRGFRRINAAERFLAEMPTAYQARFHLLRGDLFYGRQQDAPGHAESNYGQVYGHYMKAEELGATLEAGRLYRLSNSLIETGRIGLAIQFLDRIPKAESHLRHALVRKLVERNIQLPEMNYPDTFALLDRLLYEPDLKAEDRIWTLARRAELQIEQGFINEAMNGLLIAVQSLRAEGISTFPELYVLLGRAYYEAGDFDQAHRYLEEADRSLEDAHDLMSEVLLLRGIMAMNMKQLETAGVAFNRVIEEFPGSRADRLALLGRAEVHAEMRRHRESLDDYADLITHVRRELDQGRERRDLTPARIADSIKVWHDKLVDETRYDMAVRFLLAAERLYDDSPEMPDGLLIRLANTHRMLADSMFKIGLQLTSDAMERAGAPFTAPDPDRLDPATRLEIRRAYLASGEYYRRRADTLLARDLEGALDSLWAAAQVFDRGGDYRLAEDSLLRYIRMCNGESRQVEGMLMLGRVYESTGAYDQAILQFRELQEEHARTLAAEHSYVPLARCYLHDPENPRPNEAERLLLSVVRHGAPVEGTPVLNPQATDYREALITLGVLYSRAHRYELERDPATYYPLAIEYLDEATKRYRDDARIIDLHTHLAHAYRLNAKAIGEELRIVQPNAQRDILRRERLRNYDQAVANYTMSINGYSSIKPHQRTSLQNQALKLSQLWRADCVFAMGRYAEARALYEDVAATYPDDAVAMMARMQIVNAYAASGEFEEARTAHHRALAILRDMPEEVFENEVFDRETWEHWLEWTDAMANGTPMAGVDPP
ncbi:MAG: tetratricopeptide repeat protein [Planctomycetota bacterium]